MGPTERGAPPKKRRGGRDAQRPSESPAAERREEARRAQASEAARKASGDSWAPAGGTRPRRAARERKRTSRKTRPGSAKRKKGKGGEAGRSLYPCPFVERSAMPGGCRAEVTESAARGKSRTRSGG